VFDHSVLRCGAVSLEFAFDGDLSLGAAASQRTVRSMSSPALAGPVARRRKGGTSLWPFRAARGPFAGLWLVG
jgi:hypothetical protein